MLLSGLGLTVFDKTRSDS